MKKLAEAAAFTADVFDGKRPLSHFKEAMTTSDFPMLFGDTIDRMLLAGYQESPQTYQAWARIKSVADFRPVKRYYTDSGDQALAVVAEQDDYHEGSIDEGKYSYAVQKYGRVLPFSWEAMMNDDLDALKDIPDRFGRAARRTEEKFATSLICGASGPDGTFYTSPRGNLIDDTLTVAGLQAGFTAMASMLDPNDEPILNTPTILAVPPALEVTAQNILQATEVYLLSSDFSQVVNIKNWMASLQLVVLRYVPILASSNQDTSWWLFAPPNEGRGALEVGFLRGHEAPEVFMKMPNVVCVSETDPFVGSFDNDSIEYKVRHVLGGCTLDYRYSVASTGTSSPDSIPAGVGDAVKRSTPRKK